MVKRKGHESEYQRKFMELVRPEDQEWLDYEIQQRKELSEMLAKCGKA